MSSAVIRGLMSIRIPLWRKRKGSRGWPADTRRPEPGAPRAPKRVPRRPRPRRHPLRPSVATRLASGRKIAAQVPSGATRHTSSTRSTSKTVSPDSMAIPARAQSTTMSGPSHRDARDRSIGPTRRATRPPASSSIIGSRRRSPARPGAISSAPRLACSRNRPTIGARARLAIAAVDTGQGADGDLGPMSSNMHRQSRPPPDRVPPSPPAPHPPSAPGRSSVAG